MAFLWIVNMPPFWVRIRPSTRFCWLGACGPFQAARIEIGLSHSGSPVASDESLIERIVSGDASAEEELVTRFRPAIFAIATARTRDREAARDLTQEILMAVLQAARGGRIRESGKLAAYVQGTARNLINHFFETRTRRAECTLDAITEQGSDPVAEQEFRERRRLVQEQLTSCNDLDQKILLHSMVDGLNLLEVAEKLGISHEAARTRKSRLVRKITKKIEEVSHK
jgi:RNA polymerase sigma-70 factor, ECF subfamily